jgi:hypothetical protein
VETLEYITFHNAKNSNNKIHKISKNPQNFKKSTKFQTPDETKTPFLFVQRSSGSLPGSLEQIQRQQKRPPSNWSSFLARFEDHRQTRIEEEGIFNGQEQECGILRRALCKRAIVANAWFCGNLNGDFCREFCVFFAGNLKEGF